MLIFYPSTFLRSLVFRILLFSSLSLHFSLKKAFLFLLAILWNSTFSWVYLYLYPFPFSFPFPKAFGSPPEITTLSSCLSFSLEWFWSLLHVKYYELSSVVIQALCLPDLNLWIYSSPPLYNPKGFDLCHT